MASPQEYRNRITELGLDNWDVTLSSIQDAKNALNQIQRFQNKLWDIKKDIKLEISKAWNRYRSESTSSFGDSIAAAFLGKQRAYRIQKRTRTKLADDRDRKINSYREVESIIDQILSQHDSNKVKVKAFMDELRAGQNKKQKNAIPNVSQTKKRLDYHEYIRSQQWREKAEEAKAQAGNRCQVCNRSRAEVQLEAHHRTYERLGNELPEDITVLCRECHQIYEDSKKVTYQPPVEELSTGFCIRCKKTISLDPKSPYCFSCFKVWKKFDNPKYEEKYCHICGEENPSTMQKPACYDCFRRNRSRFSF